MAARVGGIGLLAALLVSVAAAQNPREKIVRDDKTKLESDESWIYNDLALGRSEARVQNKPLLVIFRCLPCEACALFDEQIVRRDPKVRELMDRFVCVRIPMANGMDLSQFQFDYDLSFSAFFMHPDGTIYGRFGTRSSASDAEKDISLEGFAAALRASLALHAAYPGNRDVLSGKQPRPVKYRTPDEFPSLRGKYPAQLNYEGQVVQSCMHCHQIRDAQREVYRNAAEPIPEQELFPYPMPQVVGFALDPKTCGTVSHVTPGSPAAQAGLREGDELLALDGQPIVSIADVQWVLHHAPQAGSLTAQVRRGPATQALRIELPAGWRRASDISWRVSTWPLRRMVTGGLVLEDLPDDRRRALGLRNDELALLVRHVGQYGAHAAARRAGFQTGDVLVAVPGISGRVSEAEFLTTLVNNTRPGRNLNVTVLRGTQRHTLSLPQQP
jgi:serine protease Do